MMAHTGNALAWCGRRGGSDDSCHRIVCVVCLVHAAAIPGFEGASVG